MKKGFTIVEITISVAILVILTTVILLIVKPQDYYKKSRDTQRLNSLSKLYEAISEYKLDNKLYPGDTGVVYSSNVGSNLTDVTSGWFGGDLSRYLQIKHIDPVNTPPLVFTYTHNETDFELNAVLEFYTDKMQEDDGNNLGKFEIGTDLELME